MRHSQKERYINSLYVKDENAILQSIRESAPHNKDHMQIALYEGEIISFFANIIGARQILEIGTFVGYSSAYIALNVMHSKVISIEKNTAHYEIAKNNIAKHNLTKQITLLYGDAISLLNTMTNDYADLIFIDGKKSEYPEYLDASYKILKKGGLIIADNTLLFDNLYLEKPSDHHGGLMWESMRAFHKKISDTNLFQMILIPTNSGMSVAMKK